jgi:ABC-type glycerol-3-phosphate transport system permease component
MNRTGRIKIGKVVENMLLFFAYFLIAVFVLVPILWMFKVALTPRLDLGIVPQRLSLEHFVTIGKRKEIWSYFFNSLKICAGTIAIALPLALIAAFSLARFNFRGKEPMAISFLILPMLPATAILVPLVSYFNKMYLYNTLISVIIVNIIFYLPLSIWMLRNFIVNTPRAIEEAAYLDGLSHIETLFRVTVPIIRPGIIAVTVYIFIGCWNGYTFSYALTTTPEKRVLAQAILAFLGAWGTDWGGLNAMGIIMVIPPILVFLIFQKSFVAGMFGQALK